MPPFRYIFFKLDLSFIDPLTFIFCKLTPKGLSAALIYGVLSFVIVYFYCNKTGRKVNPFILWISVQICEVSMEVCRGICVYAAEAVTNFLWHATIIHAALLVRFTYGFVCDAKNARCTKHTCSPRCRCLLVSLQQVVMTSSAANRQHTDDTCGYKTVDIILPLIFVENIC